MTKIARKLKDFPVSKGGAGSSALRTDSVFMIPNPYMCDKGVCYQSPPYTFGGQTCITNPTNPNCYPSLSACIAGCSGIDPSRPDLCYDIGDVGPGGGIIFAIPGYPSYVPANEYWEITATDLSSVDEPGSWDGIGIGTTAVSPSCSNFPGGTEFGLYGVSGFSSTSSALWGAGEANTITMYDADTTTYSSDLGINPGGDSACLPFQPCSPKHDSRQVSFRVAKDYNGGGFHDWFLPSWGELSIAMWNVGPTMGNSGVTNPLGPNHANFAEFGNNGQMVHYWTSSSLASPAQWFPNSSDASAMVIPPSTTNPWVSYLSSRCYVNRVRAVRKFNCDDPHGCIGAPCVDYNYRDGGWTSNGQGNMATFTGTILFTGLGFIGQGGGDNVVGGPNGLRIMLAARDVMHNDWTFTDWADASIGYTISMWDRDYVFLGTWHYTTYSNLVIDYAVNMYPTVSANLIDIFTFTLSGVTHLAGPSPIVDAGSGVPGSLNHTYVKLEAACNSNTINAFENATNATVWGNAEFPVYGINNEIPRVCDPNWYWPCYIMTWGTQTHYHTNGSMASILPDYSSCTSGCGQSVVNPGGQNGSNGVNELRSIDKTQIEETATPKTGDSKTELSKLRKKKR